MTKKSNYRLKAGGYRRHLQCEPLEDRRLLSGEPQMVLDINTNTDPSDPHQLTTLGDTVFFAADDGIHGTALWKTDGTTAGTVLVKDVQVGWEYIDDIGRSHRSRSLVRAGDQLFFVGKTKTSGYDLWVSDGTEEGTTIVKDITPGEEGLYPSNFTVAAGTLFFTVYDQLSTSNQLWKSDGTEEGTRIVNFDIDVGRILASIGETILFTAYEEIRGVGLWKSDGTLQGTQLVKDIRSGTDLFINEFTVVGDTLFFNAYDGLEHGNELWKTDGTSAGTQLVRDTIPGRESSDPQHLTNVNGVLFFQAKSAEGRFLWKSDGTGNGTVPVKRLTVSPIIRQDIVVANGKMFFASNDNLVHGSELWVSDGTDQGTQMIKDINEQETLSFSFSGFPFGNPGQPPIEYNGKMVFTTIRTQGVLWQTDGTEEGTEPIVPLLPEGPRSIYELVQAGDTLYFRGGSQDRRVLYKSDGTAEGTEIVRDIDGNPISRPYWLTAVGDVLFMSAWDDERGWELWHTDGTAQGTRLVKEIHPSNRNNTTTRPALLTNVNGTLFFTADNGVHSRELWKSDGTTEGTVMIKDIHPVAASWLTVDQNDPRDLIAIGDKLYFSADDGTHGREVWTSDGTLAGTRMVKDIFPGEETSQPNPIRLDPGISSRRFVELNGSVFFNASHSDDDFELWRTDGTEGGTQRVADLLPGDIGAYPRHLTVVDGTLFFTAATDGIRRPPGLWRSDGTEQGTFLIKNFSEAEFNRGDPFIGLNGLLFFAVQTEETGRELWQSDGTERGTVLVADIRPGLDSGRPLWKKTNSSAPELLTVLGDTLFFTADDGTHGRELWKLNVPAPRAGDTDRDGDFDPDDVINILSAGKFGQGHTGALWSEGDFDGDGDVDAHDIVMALLATGGKFPATFDSP